MAHATDVVNSTALGLIQTRPRILPWRNVGAFHIPSHYVSNATEMVNTVALELASGESAINAIEWHCRPHLVKLFNARSAAPKHSVGSSTKRPRARSASPQSSERQQQMTSCDGTAARAFPTGNPAPLLQLVLLKTKASCQSGQ